MRLDFFSNTKRPTRTVDSLTEDALKFHVLIYRKTKETFVRSVFISVTKKRKKRQVFVNTLMW